jgi:hypothetical protein
LLGQRIRLGDVGFPLRLDRFKPIASVGSPFDGESLSVGIEVAGVILSTEAHNLILNSIYFL